MFRFKETPSGIILQKFANINMATFAIWIFG